MMKKSILSLIAGAIVALTSCSQSDDMPGQPQEGAQTATFTILTPAATRSEVSDLSRYIVEAYEGSNATGTPAARVESATGTLTLGLKKNTQYTFLFWADKGTAKATGTASSGYWNTADLKAVSVTTEKESTAGEAAYCLATTFNSADFEAHNTVTLKNATAQVCFIETAGLTTAENELKVTYSAGGTLNVGTGNVTNVMRAITHTFTYNGQVAANTTLATDYILAPKGEQRMLELTIQLNVEDSKTITNVPFQQCFSTHIKGEYSSLGQFTFTVTADDDWKGMNEVTEPAEKGDYYYEDGTWSTDLDNQKRCIGIVFQVNADGQSGKIVSLNEPPAAWSNNNDAGKLSWGPAATQTDATDENDGLKNMAAIKNLSSDFSNYDAFRWVDAQNPENTDYSTATTGVWYLPAKQELNILFLAYGGPYGIGKDNFNKKLTDAKGTEIVDESYISSTETSNDQCFKSVFTYGSINIASKTNTYYVRCIRKF